MSDQEIRRYEQMLADDPKSRAFAPLAEAYRKAGQLDDAIKVAETGLRYHPDYSGGLVVLGRTLFEKGELARASEVIAKAVKEAPENYMAQKILAKISMAQGENGNALKALEAASALSPGDMEIEEALERLRGKISHPGGIDFAPEAEVDGHPEGVEPLESGTDKGGSEAGRPEEDPLPPLEEGIGLSGQGEDEVVDPFDVELKGLSTDLGELEDPPDLTPEAGVSAVPAAGEDIPPFVNDLSSLSGEAPDETHDTFLSDRAVDEAVSEVEDVMDAIITSGEEEFPMAMVSDQEVAADGADPIGENDISTETLADLYAQQGLKDKAAQIYSVLLKDRPDDPVLEEKLRKVRLGETHGTSVEAYVQDDRPPSGVPEETPPATGSEPSEISPVNDEGGLSIQADPKEGTTLAEGSEDSSPGRRSETLDILEKWLRNAERMKQR